MSSESKLITTTGTLDRVLSELMVKSKDGMDRARLADFEAPR